MTVLPFGMFDIARVSNGKTRSISAENPDGRVGGGAQEIPDEKNAGAWLGKGWKVRPCITLPPESNTVLADIEGPGTIRHIWITVDPKAYRDCILRMYWDGEKTPSVEVPLGDFFCNGHALRVNINSMMIAVNPNGGFNSYWPMPFRKHARIEVENQRWEEIGGFFYQITYELDEVPDDAAYFHAQWRRAVTPIEAPEHVILDGIKGKGQYVGTYMAWTQLANGWWGEGEIKFYLDGDDEFPTICGTGEEDYFCGSYGYDEREEDGKTIYSSFSSPYTGFYHVAYEGEQRRFGQYRWHVTDPIRFDKDLRVTIQSLGWQSEGRYLPLQDDLASVAYWYQLEPHNPFPTLPANEDLVIE